MEHTLQELLNLGLVEIGPDDSRFQKMQNAANALSKNFAEKPELLVTATLIALDDDSYESEPFFPATRAVSPYLIGFQA